MFLDQPLDLLLVAPLVGLRPRTVHGRAFAAVEQAELQAGRVDRLPHGAAQRIDLADDLPLGHAADRRVAAHLGDRVQVDRQQRRARSHAGGGQGRLGAGVSGTHHDDVIFVASLGFHQRFQRTGSGKPRGAKELGAERLQIDPTFWLVIENDAADTPLQSFLSRRDGR